MNREALWVDYNSKRERLERVMENLHYLLEDAREVFHNRFPNIAMPKYPEVRIKAFAKIIEKLERKDRDWLYDTIFIETEDGSYTTIVNDIVAGKLVCATLDDVKNLGDILKEWSSNRLLDFNDEYVFNERTGYRAYHIDAKLAFDYKDRRIFFPVEIQVKTLLQDAWANFDHDELYKPSDEPPEISKKISCHIADALYALDQIGQVIRDEKFKKRPAVTEIGKEETLVTQQTLNYLVNQIFNVTMSEVELQKCVTQLKAFDYMSIAQVDALARDERIATNIEVAKARLHISSKVTPYEIFYFGPLAAKEGVEGVIAELRRVYSLTEITCDGCGRPISEEDKNFRDEQTDLDEIYYCSLCRVSKLRKCNNCEKFTESEICKDCRSLDVSVEIV